MPDRLTRYQNSSYQGLNVMLNHLTQDTLKSFRFNQIQLLLSEIPTVTRRKTHNGSLKKNFNSWKTLTDASFRINPRGKILLIQRKTLITHFSSEKSLGPDRIALKIQIYKLLI